MNFEVTGKVVVAPTTQTGTSAKGEWGRTQLVIEVQDGSYTKKLVMENRKKYNEFAKLRIGQIARFKFDLSSREWNGRWYTSAECWGWDIDAPASAPVDDAPF